MELVSAPKYVKYAESNKGDVLVDGIYVESKEGRYGIQHVFEAEDGQRTVLNSSGQLNYLVDSYLVEGQRCKVVYDGKVTLEKGAMAGKQAHQFNLFRDKAVSKAVNPAGSNVVESNTIRTDDLE